ncbi:class IV adenylate cyclase [Halorubrum sp. SD626R]|uniref:class IV adenylate cyclase n=1 Tax=Halorubrum sp. SD626R TaxID=1419722 RepID=UPI0010F8B510|nr:class IV adenylate cyclase [Halorubrum sp. SD626R]TKX78038.1 class IV adenylate cyclase [Halorubrum sp. SD626R]
MYEVEIKVPADVEAVRERLRRVDAERVGARRQRDVYYDAPHRDFAETDEALRLRRETPIASVSDSRTTRDEDGLEPTKLTYKGPLVDEGSKTRIEHETGVDDGEAASGVFGGLGFEPAATVEKRREFWRYDGYTVTLDDVDGLGEFVEVEREVEDEPAVASARDAAVDVLSELGLDGTDQIRTSYLGLLLEGE